MNKIDYIKSKAAETFIAAVNPKLKTFYKWFVSFSLIVSMFALAVGEGWIKVMVESDVSKLSVIISILFFIFSLFTGYLAFTSDGKDKRMKIINFARNHFFTLGILGTVAGLIYMTSNVLTSGTDTQDIIVGLKNGLATSLLTTAAGIVASLLLHIQTFILKYNEE